MKKWTAIMLCIALTLISVSVPAAELNERNETEVESVTEASEASETEPEVFETETTDESEAKPEEETDAETNSAVLFADEVVDSGTCGDNVKWSLDTSTGVLTITGTGVMYDYYSYPYASNDYAPWYYDGDYIKSVVINDGVTSIGKFAFRGCSNLTSVIIPDSVTSIGDYAFINCPLPSITIPDSVTSIEGNTFWNCINLTSITIPDSVTSIGTSAFRGCRRLTNITIPDSVTSIGQGVFEGCNNLTSITIPDGVTSIGANTFYTCSSLTSVTIPDSVTSIGTSAFRGCSSLTNITIPDSVTSIGQGVFEGCSSLTCITIGNSVTSIGGWAFHGCSSLTSITIPDSVTRIESSAFMDCSSLTSIIIPDNVTRIGDNAFEGCSSLTSITIPDSITSIEWMTFCYCSSLTSIAIPDSVKYISGYVFYGCDKLSDVYYSGSEEQWKAISIGDGNGALTDNTIIHYNSSMGGDTGDDDDGRTLCVFFSGGDDIIYNSDEMTYSTDRFALTAVVDNLKSLNDMLQGDTTAKDVKIEITLPSGYSFDEAGTVNNRVHSFEEIEDREGFSETVYLKNPPVGESEMTVTISGSNIKKDTFTYSFIVGTTKFELNKYRAEFLLNVNMDDGIESSAFGATPGKEIRRAGLECGMEDAAGAWNAVMDIIDAVDSPSSIIDYTFEEKDMYTAIIMALFESSVDYRIMDCINNDITKQTKELVSTVTSEMMALYNIDVIDSETFKTLTEAQKEDVIEGISEGFKDAHEDADFVSNLTDKIGQAIEYATDFQTYCETVSAYYKISALNNSMKHVLRDMYAKCPIEKHALKAALLDCMNVMDAGEKEFELKMGAYGLAVVGKDVAQAYIDKLWGSIKDSFSAAHPAAFAISAGLKAGKYVTQVCYNSDALAEKYFNIVALLEVEELMKEVYYSEKSTFISDATEEKAAVYNSTIDILFNMLNTDCDYVIGFAKEKDKALVGAISKWLGNTTTEDLISKTEGIQGDCKSHHEEILISWISNLEEEGNISKYNEYKHILDEYYGQLTKKYNVNCPVDVYIYDKAGVLVGSVIDDKPYCRNDANITISTEGDKKTIYFSGAEEYDIVYEGNDTGKMDISVTEYDENQAETRNVYFNNIALTEGLTYTSKEGSETSEYTLTNEDSQKIAPDYDTVNIDGNVYTATVERGYFADFSLTADLHNGENAEVTAYVPEGYKFVGWTSDVGEDIFEDAKSITTRIHMPEQNIIIKANIEYDSEEDTQKGDVNGDEEVNAKDVTMLRRFIAGGYGAEVTEKIADANGDGEVNAKDVTMLRRYIAGGYGIELNLK